MTVDENTDDGRSGAGVYGTVSVGDDVVHRGNGGVGERSSNSTSLSTDGETTRPDHAGPGRLGPPKTTFEVVFDVTETTVCEAVVSAVATTTNTAPLDLPPLSRTVDVEAVDRLVQHSRNVTVRFPYTGVLVVVTGPRRVRGPDPTA